MCVHALTLQVPSAAACAAATAYAGHAIVSNLFPWNQGKYDGLIAKQLKGVSDADLTKAEEIAVPIAVKILRERWAGRAGWPHVPAWHVAD